MLSRRFVKTCRVIERPLSLFIVGVLFPLKMGMALAQIPPSLPKPTGSFAVGTTEFRLVDNSRQEIFTADPNDKRELYLRVWYPAQQVPKGAKPLPIFGSATKETTRNLAEDWDIPEKSLDSLALVPSHTFANVPLAEVKTEFPVVVFSHGYDGFAAQNIMQMQELASHGYVVFGIGHTYETIVNVFPDGRIIPASKTRIAEFSKPNQKASQLYEKYMAATNQAEKVDLAKQFLKEKPLVNESLGVWTADMRFILDEIEKMNAVQNQSIFVKKLDTKHIGIMGMSLGGATAGQVCFVDKRCHAGINMDGLQFGDVFGNQMPRPFMFMQSESAAKGINRDVYEASKADAYFVVVKGSKHWNFSAANLLAALDKEGRFVGKIPGDRMETIVSSYVLAFFDKYLKGKDSPLLQGDSAEFTEVEFSSRQTK